MKIFSLEDVELSFTDEAIEEVARLTLAQKTGARGLRSILETAMIDLMFDLPSKASKLGKIVITGDFINNRGDAEFVERHSREVA